MTTQAWSPRCVAQTAAPIAARHGLEPTVVEGLVEYDVQADHYVPVEELRASQDERWRALVEGRWGELGGESVETFTARVCTTVDELIAANPGRNLVAVCHGGVINVALALALGLDRVLWFDPFYTSVSRLAAARSGVRSVLTLNETAHLEATRTR